MARSGGASQGGARRTRRAGTVSGTVVEPAEKPVNPNHPLYRAGCDPAAVALEALGKFILRMQALERGEVRPAGYEDGHDEDADAVHLDAC